MDRFENLLKRQKKTKKQQRKQISMERNIALLLALLVLKKRELQKSQEPHIKTQKYKMWIREILTERSLKGDYIT